MPSRSAIARSPIIAQNATILPKQDDLQHQQNLCAFHLLEGIPLMHYEQCGTKLVPLSRLFSGHQEKHWQVHVHERCVRTGLGAKTAGKDCR